MNDSVNENLDVVRNNDNYDAAADEMISNCLNADHLKSFFVFAGAGSGKTRSLINALNDAAQKNGEVFHQRGKKIAVITYTNAASDEISRRLGYNPLFRVSTIHSFLWSIIEPHQVDIKKWMINQYENSIEDLKGKIEKGKTSKTLEKNKSKLLKKTHRLNEIKKIYTFSYSPNGENLGFGSLNHSDVVKIGTDFLNNQIVIQQIFVGRYPILMIDESQDTNKHLVDAFLKIEEVFSERFSIGMFGDMMQRVYSDGKENMESHIPKRWEKPVKVMNHRSAKRIVKLANSIRSGFDDHEQTPRSDAPEGSVRLFIGDSMSDFAEVERHVSKEMVTITGDIGWHDNYKSLILEHHMAATRFNFESFYIPLRDSKEFESGLVDGSIPEFKLLSSVILPMILAKEVNDDFTISEIVRNYAVQLDPKFLKVNKTDSIHILNKVQESANSLLHLLNNDNQPTCKEIFLEINRTGLFEIHDRIIEALQEPSNEDSTKVIALRKALDASIGEFIKYHSYVNEETPFDTQQGVKGLEFPRVMVIVDDESARGFLFSYEKLFGVKELTSTDILNIRENKDNSISRTSRLFYVACTRAERSLAIVVYTLNKNEVKNDTIRKKWFLEDEISLIS